MPVPRQDPHKPATPAREGQVTRPPRAEGRGRQIGLPGREFRPYRYRQPRHDPRAGLAVPPADCAFCDLITAGRYEIDAGLVVAFTPRNPVAPGHLLVVPVQHVADALEQPSVTGLVMAAAADLARRRHRSLNLITSVGPAATQTVRHLHVHLVPRQAGDGLALPWTRQKEEAAC